VEVFQSPSHGVNGDEHNLKIPTFSAPIALRSAPLVKQRQKKIIPQAADTDAEESAKCYCDTFGSGA
jgi:hypothetical protein